MNKSEQIGQLAAALARVQAQLRPAKFNAQNPFLKNKYADLGSIVDSCRDLLASNGLSVTQLPGTPPAEFGPGVTLTTVLMHESGEWIAESLAMPIAKGTAQDVGSALTYARRYSLAAMIGIVSDEDDDGNRASGTGKTAAKSPTAKQAVKQSPSTAPANVDTATGEIASNGGDSDPRGETSPQAQAARAHLRPTAENSQPVVYRQGDEVMVRGKSDEKPGTVTAVFDDGKIQVKVDGKVLTVAPEKLTLISI